MKNMVPDVKTVVALLVMIVIAALMNGCATGGFIAGPFSSLAVTSNQVAMSERRGAANADSMTGGEILKNIAGLLADGLLYVAVSKALQDEDDGGSSAPSQAYTVSGNGNTLIIGNGAGVSVDNSEGM